MTNNTKQTNKQNDIFYNNILLLCRNTIFYTKFHLNDTFQNRIHLIFIHISFIFIKIKKNDENKTYKIFYQKIFDLIFNRIEINMREIGYGDTTINKNMRSLVKTFYNILFDCERYEKMNTDTKNKFFNKYLLVNDIKNTTDNTWIIDYFDKYKAFCFDLSPDSVLRGDLNFKYE